MGLRSSLIQRDVWALANFAPGGALTTANFEQALLDALAAADASTAIHGVTIMIPAGTWPMTQTIRLKGRTSAGGQRFAPFLQGAGVYNTRLTWAALPTGGTFSGAGVCIWLDGSHADNHPFYGGGCDGFEIQYLGEHGATGFYGEAVVHSQLRNLKVTGYGNLNYYTNVSGQTGSAASCGATDSNGVQTWTGLTGITKDCEGRVLTTTGASSGVNNGTFLITQYVSATSVKVFNESGTSDANNGALGWTEKFAATGYKFRGDYTNSRGILTTNNQDTRTDNIHCYGVRIGGWFESCTQWTNTHLKLENCANNVCLSHNVDIFGVYGGVVQGITQYTFWEIPGRVGGKHVTLRDVYQEGAATAWLKTYPPTSGVSNYVLENCNQGNATTYLDLNGTRSVVCTNPGNSVSPTVWVKARSCGNITLEGAVFDPFITSPYGNTYVRDTTKYDIDQFSYEGFSVNSRRGLFSAQVVPQKSVNRILFERDLAVEIWDPRVISSCSINGGNLEAITGLLNGIVAGPVNAAIYPTHQASNSAIGDRPSFTTTAAAAGSGGMLKATISSGLMPIGSSPGVLFVFRLASATPDGSNYRYIGFTGADTRRREFHLADSVTNGYLALDTYGGNFTIQAAAETVPQVGLLAAVCREGSTPTKIVHGSTGIVIGAQVNNFELTTAGGTVYMGGDAAHGSASVEIAYVALLKRPLGMQEHHALLDACSLEWPGINRY